MYLFCKLTYHFWVKLITMETTLIPIRRLSNLIYCERLFYFQYVENIFVEDSATAEGRLVHRVVDNPTENRQRITSLHLSSEALGITGKIDAAEIVDGSFEIVEYKRGAAHRNEEDEIVAKEWDVVQVIAQALLLKEHSY
jgi:CRISP-associated protein Cas1